MLEFSVVGKIAALFMGLGFFIFLWTLSTLFTQVEGFTEDVMQPATRDQHATLNMGYEAPERRKILVEEPVERHVARQFSPTISPVVVVVASALNLRSEPTIHAPSIGHVKRGTRLEFLRQTSGPWLRVRATEEGIDGWVYGKFVAGGHTIR
ncbi:MAG: SH3 domain-containing protein [Pseudomonadota bacterium]